MKKTLPNDNENDFTLELDGNKGFIYTHLPVKNLIPEGGHRTFKTKCLKKENGKLYEIVVDLKSCATNLPEDTVKIFKYMDKGNEEYCITLSDALTLKLGISGECYTVMTCELEGKNLTLRKILIYRKVPLRNLGCTILNSLNKPDVDMVLHGSIAFVKPEVKTLKKILKANH